MFLQQVFFCQLGLGSSEAVLFVLICYSFLNYNCYITQHLITRFYPCFHLNFISLYQSCGQIGGHAAGKYFPHDVKVFFQFSLCHCINFVLHYCLLPFITLQCLWCLFPCLYQFTVDISKCLHFKKLETDAVSVLNYVIIHFIYKAFFLTKLQST